MEEFKDYSSLLYLRITKSNLALDITIFFMVIEHYN